MSVLTVGEIRRGIERIRRRDAPAAGALETWLAGILEDYRDRILSVDEAVAQAWGARNVPDPVPVPVVDGLLAATAQVHGLTLATRNTRDIRGTGVSCVDPFEPA